MPGDPSSNGAFGRPKLGSKSTLRNPSMPGPREPKSATAGPVARENGKVARPGGRQHVPSKSGGGTGSIARPGGGQKIKG